MSLSMFPSTQNVEWMAQEKIDELLRWKYPPNLEDYFPWWVCGFDEFGGPSETKIFKFEAIFNYKS